MRIDQQRAKDFILAGKCLITFNNTDTKGQFTFVIRRGWDKLNSKPKDIWWVSINHDLIGRIVNENFIGKGDVAKDRVQAREVFAWMWHRIVNLQVPNYIEMLHPGICGACGRTLTDAISIHFGIGPECRKKLGIT